MLIREIITERKQLNEIAPLVVLGWLSSIAAAGFTAWRMYETTQELARGEITQEQLLAEYGKDIAQSIIEFVAFYGAGRILSMSWGTFRRLWAAAKNRPRPDTNIARDAAAGAGSLGVAQAASSAMPKAPSYPTNPNDPGYVDPALMP